MKCIVFLWLRWPLVIHITLAILRRLVKALQPFRFFQLLSFNLVRLIFNAHDLPTVLFEVGQNKFLRFRLRLGCDKTVNHCTTDFGEQLATRRGFHFALEEEQVGHE